MGDELSWDVLRTVLKVALKPEKRPGGGYFVHSDNPPIHVEADTVPELQRKLVEELKTLTSVSRTVSEHGGVSVKAESNTQKLSWDIKERAGGGFTATSADPPMTVEADTREELQQKLLARFSAMTGAIVPAATPEWFKDRGFHAATQVKTNFKITSRSGDAKSETQLWPRSTGTASTQNVSGSGNPIIVGPESSFSFQKLAGIGALLFFLFLLWQFLHR